MQDKKPVQFAEEQGARVPPCTVPFYHVVDLQTRFNDIDMLGHLNNNVYLEFMDLGKTRYMTDVMGPVDWMRFTAVVVHIDCDYFAPAFLGEPLAVATTVTGVSKHSFRLEQRIFDRETGQVKCIGRTVMAGFDPVTGGSAEISPAWIIEFSRYEGRNL